MSNIMLEAGAVRAGAASRYGSGSDQMMRLLAAPALQHWYRRCILFKNKRTGEELSVRGRGCQKIILREELYMHDTAYFDKVSKKIQ
jgi:hypothetical protein